MNKNGLARQTRKHPACFISFGRVFSLWIVPSLDDGSVDHVSAIEFLKIRNVKIGS